MIDLIESNGTRSLLLTEASKMLPNLDINDRTLLELYFQIQFQKKAKDAQGQFPPLSDFPYHLSYSEPQSESHANKILDIAPDVFTFLKFGTPGLVKDFSLFHDICCQAGFNEESILPEIVIQIILTITDKKEESDDALCSIINTLTEKTVHMNSLSADGVSLLRKSMNGYGLKIEDKVVEADRRFIDAKENSYLAVNLLQNDLKVTSIAEQFAICNDYYHRLNTANKLYNKYDFKLTSRFLEDKSTLEIKTLLDRLCSCLKKSTPRHIIEAMYQKKKTQNSSANTVRNRCSSAQAECGIAYYLFTSSLSPGCNVLVVLPSPYFVRKWTKDRLVHGHKTTFVVPSQEEKGLWERYYDIYEKRDDIFFETLEGLMSERSSIDSFSRIAVFALAYEESAYRYPGTISNLSDLGHMISESGQGRLVLCLTANEGLRRRGFFSNTFIRTGREIRYLITLPNEVEGPGKRKKSLWIGTTGEAGEKPTIWYETRKKGGFIHINEQPSDCRIDFQSYLSEGGDTDIITFTKNSLKTPPQRRRIEPKEYDYTPDITFCYTSSPHSNYPDKRRVTAYLKTDESRVVIDGVEEPINVYEFTSAYKLLPNDRTIHWLENEYPYKTAKGKDGTYSIQNRIATVMRTELKGKSICMKSFMYIYDDELHGLYGDNVEVFLKRFANSSVGKIPMRFLSEESVTKGINEANYTEISEYKQALIVRRLLDIAVEEEVLKTNPMVSSDHIGKGSPRELINIRSALATKTFTREQFRKFFKLTVAKMGINMEGIRSGNPSVKKDFKPDCRFLGVVIKLLTGLENRAISVLQWKDYHMIRDFGVYQLQVYKHYVRRGKDENKDPWEVCKSDTKIRCIPCSSILASILNCMKKHMEAESNEKYILTNTDEPMSPDSISRAFKEIMDKMGLEKIAEQSILDESLDLSEYGGSFLTENFRFAASDMAGLQADEIAFILGNTPQTTFGIHYCDYNNPAAQYMERIKLNRIDAQLTCNSKFSVPKAENMTTEHRFASKNSTYPIQLNIAIDKKNEDMDSVVEIISEYGVSVFSGEENETR